MVVEMEDDAIISTRNVCANLPSQITTLHTLTAFSAILFGRVALTFTNGGSWVPVTMSRVQSTKVLTYRGIPHSEIAAFVSLK